MPLPVEDAGEAVGRIPGRREPRPPVPVRCPRGIDIVHEGVILAEHAARPHPLQAVDVGQLIGGNGAAVAADSTDEAAAGDGEVGGGKRHKGAGDLVPAAASQGETSCAERCTLGDGAGAVENGSPGDRQADGSAHRADGEAPRVGKAQTAGGRGQGADEVSGVVEGVGSAGTGEGELRCHERTAAQLAYRPGGGERQGVGREVAKRERAARLVDRNHAPPPIDAAAGLAEAGGDVQVPRAGQAAATHDQVGGIEAAGAVQRPAGDGERGPGADGGKVAGTVAEAQAPPGDDQVFLAEKGDAVLRAARHGDRVEAVRTVDDGEFGGQRRVPQAPVHRRRPVPVGVHVPGIGGGDRRGVERHVAGVVDRVYRHADGVHRRELAAADPAPVGEHRVVVAHALAVGVHAVQVERAAQGGAAGDGKQVVTAGARAAEFGVDGAARPKDQVAGDGERADGRPCRRPRGDHAVVGEGAGAKGERAGAADGAGGGVDEPRIGCRDDAAADLDGSRVGPERRDVEGAAGSGDQSVVGPDPGGVQDAAGAQKRSGIGPVAGRG